MGEWNVRTRIRIRCEISKYLWDYYRLFAGTKPYSIISSLPLEQLDLTNIANFSKDEFDILKHSIAVSVARNKIKATELKDRVIEKNQLSEKDAELLNKIFEEVKTYWENWEDASLQNSLPKCVQNIDRIPSFSL